MEFMIPAEADVLPNPKKSENYSEPAGLAKEAIDRGELQYSQGPITLPKTPPPGDQHPVGHRGWHGKHHSFTCTTFAGGKPLNQVDEALL